MHRITPYIVLFLIGTTLLGCASRRDMAYMQGQLESKGGTADEKAVSYEPKIQPNDILQINVTAENPEVAAPYNLKSPSVEGVMSGQTQTDNYLVDVKGEIDFVQLGKIKLGGLTRLEAIAKIKDILKDHIQNPNVNLRILNFKVSVVGEVNRPGVFTSQGERLTLLEALGMAGDLTIFGKRKNIKVIRETDGQKSITEVDITKTDFMQSPYYYLAQNDVIYVEPNKPKMNASKIDPSISLILGTVSMAVSIMLLISRL